jgi:hypothetical protein
MTALDEAAAALAANDMARVEAITGEILQVQPAHPMALHLQAAALSAQGRAAVSLLYIFEPGSYLAVGRPAPSRLMDST